VLTDRHKYAIKHLVHLIDEFCVNVSRQLLVMGNLIICVFCLVQRRLPFTVLYEPPQTLYSSQGQYFMPGQRITVEIFKIEQTEHLQLLNRNLYV